MYPMYGYQPALPQPDLNGFPLIRLDHVPLLSDALLFQARDELAVLIYSLSRQAPESVGGLLQYAARQQDAVAQELAMRETAARLRTMMQQRSQAAAAQYAFDAIPEFVAPPPLSVQTKPPPPAEPQTTTMPTTTMHATLPPRATSPRPATGRRKPSVTQPPAWLTSAAASAVPHASGATSPVRPRSGASRATSAAAKLSDDADDDDDDDGDDVDDAGNSSDSSGASASSAKSDPAAAAVPKPARRRRAKKAAEWGSGNFVIQATEGRKLNWGSSNAKQEDLARQAEQAKQAEREARRLRLEAKQKERAAKQKQEAARKRATEAKSSAPAVLPAPAPVFAPAPAPVLSVAEVNQVTSKLPAAADPVSARSSLSRDGWVSSTAGVGDDSRVATALPIALPPRPDSSPDPSPIPQVLTTAAPPPAASNEPYQYFFNPAPRSAIQQTWTTAAQPPLASLPHGQDSADKPLISVRASRPASSTASRSPQPLRVSPVVSSTLPTSTPASFQLHTSQAVIESEACGRPSTADSSLQSPRGDLSMASDSIATTSVRRTPRRSSTGNAAQPSVVASLTSASDQPVGLPERPQTSARRVSTATAPAWLADPVAPAPNPDSATLAADDDDDDDAIFERPAVPAATPPAHRSTPADVDADVDTDNDVDTDTVSKPTAPGSEATNPSQQTVGGGTNDNDDNDDNDADAATDMAQQRMRRDSYDFDSNIAKYLSDLAAREETGQQATDAEPQDSVVDREVQGVTDGSDAPTAKRPVGGKALPPRSVTRLRKTEDDAGPRMGRQLTSPTPTTKYLDLFPEFKRIFTANYTHMRAMGPSGGTRSQPLVAEMSTETSARAIVGQYELFCSIMNQWENPFTVGSGAAGAPPAAGSSDAGVRKQYYKVVQSRNEVYKIVTTAMKKIGPSWEELPSSVDLKMSWDLMWTWSKPKVEYNLLCVWQRVNHFLHNRELSRKDMLRKNLARYQCVGGRLASAFELCPPTFVLPKEYLAFTEAFARGSSGMLSGHRSYPATATSSSALAASIMAGLKGTTTEAAGAATLATDAAGAPQPPNIWIMKPVALSRGRGISLVSDIGAVTYGDAVVIQKYVHNPLLLDGYKFDLRIYVLVTSFNPVEAFVYKEGFARLSTHLYSMDPADLANKFIHLTNSSIQKYSDAIADTIGRGGAEDVGGTKCTLTYLWRRLRDRGIDTDQVWSSIIDVIVKSLVCVDDCIPYQPNSFEVFGYDVLLDDTLRPWLIEVNASPSMGTDSAMDEQVKAEMVKDTIMLVNPLPFNRVKLMEVIERRQADAKSKRRLFSQPGGLDMSERMQLEADLDGILYGQVPRRYGEMPAHLGLYQRICPASPQFDKAMKLKNAHFKKQPVSVPTPSAAAAAAGDANK